MSRLEAQLYRNHTEAWLEKNIKDFDSGDWHTISMSQKLSEPFIEKYADKVDWEEIFSHQDLSMDFIEANLNRVPKERLKRKIEVSQKLSEDFIERNFDWLDKLNTCYHQTLSEAFLERHFSEFDETTLGYICIRQKLSEDFLERHIDKLARFFKTEVAENQEFSQQFFEKYKELFPSLKELNAHLSRPGAKMALPWVKDLLPLQDRLNAKDNKLLDELKKRAEAIGYSLTVAKLGRIEVVNKAGKAIGKSFPEDQLPQLRTFITGLETASKEKANKADSIAEMLKAPNGADKLFKMLMDANVGIKTISEVADTFKENIKKLSSSEQAR